MKIENTDTTLFCWRSSFHGNESQHGNRELLTNKRSSTRVLKSIDKIKHGDRTGSLENTDIGYKSSRRSRAGRPRFPLATHRLLLLPLLMHNPPALLFPHPFVVRVVKRRMHNERQHACSVRHRRSHFWLFFKQVISCEEFFDPQRVNLCSPESVPQVVFCALAFEPKTVLPVWFENVLVGQGTTTNLKKKGVCNLYKL